MQLYTCECIQLTVEGDRFEDFRLQRCDQILLILSHNRFLAFRATSAEPPPLLWFEEVGEPTFFLLNPVREDFEESSVLIFDRLSRTVPRHLTVDGNHADKQ